MRCPYCQHENKKENLYCSQCGMKLLEKLQDVQVQKGGVAQSKGQGEKIILLLSLVVVLILGLLLAFFFWITSLRGLRTLYQGKQYTAILLLYDLGGVKKDKQVYVGLAYDGLDREVKAYKVYQKVY